MAELTPIGAADRASRLSDNQPGERRQVTVLFADMVGFTAASERLGEEGTYALIQPIYELMEEAVRDQKGTVKSFTGDGIMALFGVPVALEDAPLRACRAALLIQDRLLQIADDIEANNDFRPQIRIGINSGLVVVARVQGGDLVNATALGDTVNFASRLQTLAEPGAVFLSEATQRLVEGLVDVEFVGEREVKGKAELQRVYRLNAVRKNIGRFDAAISRGLTEYIGRHNELELLQDRLRDINVGVRVIDIVGEPGMGKSRLLHQFREARKSDQTIFLIGNCSPDGQQTAFLPFIEIVRGAFRVASGESELEVIRKLENGLSTLDLKSPQNLGLLLNLLGLAVPEGALSGLDGVLVGLRTRELLIQLLQARCRLTPVVVILEDLHWLDAASEELLGKIINERERLSLLILHTRRHEYQPPWMDRASTIPLEPLSRAETTRILQARMGLEKLPADLADLMTEKAEGNALFAEELASFLLERGIVRQSSGRLEYDENAVAAAMPASVQSLLTARVDQLAPDDRALLQTAAAIGRRFDLSLLASVANSTVPSNDLLRTLTRLGLAHEDPESAEYSFKHALVRDALYGSLLAGPRSALHLKIADEIERRSNNRLIESAEILAHHYGQTKRVKKAFFYSAMAAQKSLRVYSLEEAESFCKMAMSLLTAHPECAEDEEIAQFLADYAFVLELNVKISDLINVLEPCLPRIERLGNHRLSALILHHYSVALYWATRFEEANAAQRKLSAMASILRDDVSTVYAFAARVLVETVAGTIGSNELAEGIEPVMAAALRADDKYVLIWLHWVLAWDACHHGLINDCYSHARKLIEIGRRVNDPRALGFGLWLMGYAAVILDDYPAALSYAEESLDVVKTPFDVRSAISVKAITLVLLRRLDEGVPILQQCMKYNTFSGHHYQNDVGLDAFWGVALVLRGNFGAGIRQIKKIIAELELKGYRAAADWHRMTLSDIYLEILEAKQMPPLKVLIRNLPEIVRLKLFGLREVDQMMKVALANRQFAPDGSGHSKMNFILGRRAKLGGDSVLAKIHLEKARRIASLYGNTPILRKIEAQMLGL